MLAPGGGRLVAEEGPEVAQGIGSFPPSRRFKRVPHQRPIAAEAGHKLIDVTRVERPGIASDHVANCQLVSYRKRVRHDVITVMEKLVT